VLRRSGSDVIPNTTEPRALSEAHELLAHARELAATCVVLFSGRADGKFRHLLPESRELSLLDSDLLLAHAFVIAEGGNDHEQHDHQDAKGSDSYDESSHGVLTSASG